jgi:hypothetical protein
MKMDENKPLCREYFLDSEGYFVTKKIFKSLLEKKECEKCGNLLYFIYAEKYLHFPEVNTMIIMGFKIYGLECGACNCCFIYNNDEI